MKVIFAGTPDFSIAALQALLDSKHEVIAVYTQPDRPAGRGRKLTASPVKVLAEAHQLPIYQPESLRDTEAQAQLAQLNADVMVVVAYGLILPQAVLDMPKHGCLNIHASLLPRWRGAAPIQRAIEMGDAQTGVTIMQMDKGLDTGDMLTVATTEIKEDDTAQTLHDRLQTLGSKALLDTLTAIETQRLHPVKQNESEATYAEKMTKAEAQIDWNQTAQNIARKVQAFNPWPVAFTPFNSQPLRIWQARALPSETVTAQPGEVMAVQKEGMDIQTGKGILRCLQVQPAGKKAMSAYDFAQARNLVGTMLGDA